MVVLKQSGIFKLTVDAPIAPATQSLFSKSSVPANLNDGLAGFELGMRFSSNVAGQITAIQYYKPSSEGAGTHTGRIWNGSTLALLTSVSFANETASGWQEQALSTPLSISANTIYIVSYNTISHYNWTANAFPASNGNLSSASGPNGVFSGSAGSVPTSGSGQAASYFVDIVFVPG